LKFLKEFKRFEYIKRSGENEGLKEREYIVQDGDIIHFRFNV